MAQKAKKAARIVAVMKKLERMEELQKIELQRQLSELRRSEEDIIRAMNRDDAIHGMFIDTSTRFLRSLAQDAERVSRAQERNTQKLRERAGKVRQAEKLHETISRRTEQAETEKQLSDVIELYAGRRGTSLP
jgi:hypothetical protein